MNLNSSLILFGQPLVLSMYYFKFSKFLKEKYGEKVWKITVDAGYSCPNRDIVTGKEGCIFCRVDSFSKMQSLKNLAIAIQVKQGIHDQNIKGVIKKYIVYFQASTNTYAPIEILKRNFYEALAFEQVVGLSIATRPDCLLDPILKILAELSQRTEVWVEIGVQTSHDRTLNLLNRGHTFQDFVNAVEKLKNLHLRICAHLMLGLPGENADDVMSTAEQIALLPIHEIKIHPLLILKNTPLAELLCQRKIHVLELQEYIGSVCDFLERLPAGMVIQRLTAEAPSEILIAPQWALNKHAILGGIDKEFQRRNTCQGTFLTHPHTVI
jgi:radical SAM protein (TIGR01212 family)